MCVRAGVHLCSARRCSCSYLLRVCGSSACALVLQWLAVVGWGCLAVGAGLDHVVLGGTAQYWPLLGSHSWVGEQLMQALHTQMWLEHLDSMSLPVVHCMKQTWFEYHVVRGGCVACVLGEAWVSGDYRQYYSCVRST